VTYNSGVEYHPRQPERKKSNGLFRRLMLLFAAAGIIVLGFVADTRKSRSFPASVAQLSVQEISDFDFDQMTGTAEDVPARSRNLDGKRIVLVGRMWAPHASNGRIDSFQLAPSHLSEFKPPLAQEFIACRVDTPVFYFDGDVRAAGTVHIKVVHDEYTGMIRSVFLLDVDQVKPVNQKEVPVELTKQASFLHIY
jgi:hypothetical protein